MKVFFLGTGAAEGFPALFCDCRFCVEAKQRGGKNRRTRASILLNDTIKIDLSPDTLANAHAYPQINFAGLQHLLFTHSHDDHFAVRELQYLSPNFAPGRKQSLNVWATNELIRKMIPEMAHFYERAPLRFHTLAPYEEAEVGSLTVVPITAHHKMDELCLNFLVTEKTGDNDKTLLYASDTGWYDDETWEYLATCQIDCVIMECGKGDSDNPYDGHMSIADTQNARECLLKSGTIQPDTPFYLTHIAHTGLFLHEEMEDYVQPMGMLVAYDGLEVHL